MSRLLELAELAERCERATGPDFSLDCDIARAMWAGWERGVAPATTASLDAAMTLLDGLQYVAATVNWSRIGSGIAEVYLDNPGPMFGSEAATPALALCAAALKARAQAKDRK